MLTRRRLLAGAAVAAGVASVSRTARAQAIGLRITRHRVPWPGVKRLRVVQYTDVHVGWATPERVLRRAAEMGHRLEPDLVVLTGDYVNTSVKHVDRLRAFVAALPKPCFAVLGNHDHWSGPLEVTRALQEGGAEVLANGSSGIDGRGWSLPVVGVDDGYTRNHDITRAFEGIRDPEATLVLNHFPNTADEIAHTGARLIVSGHTHGGQMVIPGLTHALSRLAGNRYFHGWYDLEGSQLYVSAGIGHSLEGLRGGHTAAPEIAVFELDPSARRRESRAYSASIRA